MLIFIYLFCLQKNTLFSAKGVLIDLHKLIIIYAKGILDSTAWQNGLGAGERHPIKKEEIPWQ